MVKQITPNQYKKILIDFFKSHLQINTVLFGNQYDFNANGDIVYPVANVRYLDSSTNNQSIIDRFEIVIADLQDDEDDDAEFEIINDTTQIAYDVVNYLNKDEFSFMFQVSNVTTINIFSERNTDITAGVTFAVNLTQQRIINPCNVPLSTVLEPITNNVFSYTLPFKFS